MASGCWVQFAFRWYLFIFIRSSIGSLIFEYSRSARFSFCWRNAVLWFWLFWFWCHRKDVVHFFLIKGRIKFWFLFVNDFGFLLFFLCLHSLFASRLKPGSVARRLHLHLVSFNAAYSHLPHLVARRSHTSARLLTPSCSSFDSSLSLFSLNKVLCFWFQFRYQVNFVVNRWIRRF